MELLSSLQRLTVSPPFETTALAGSLWMIIALPILGAVVCGVFGRMMGRANTHLVACGAVAGSFVLSLLAFWALASNSTVFNSPFQSGFFPYALGHDHGTWFSAGSFRVNFGLLVDRLSICLLLVITGVGFLIHLYSTEYMSHDEGYGRYFAYLNLFVAMMLTLVLADNLVLLFVGWEGVGLCSYLLIGFWYTDPSKAFAGRKAFITNRVGDFGVLIAMFLLVLLSDGLKSQSLTQGGGSSVVSSWREGLKAKGPLDFKGLEVLSRSFAVVPHGAEPAPSVLSLHTPLQQGPLKSCTVGGVITAVMLLLLLGAAGKSAQIPLYVWLPDAMAGPTPVSALIHAATMVTAGVYLFSRMSFLLVLSPTAMAAVTLVGGATALFAAVIAFAQDDIKKVLAYSTVSQLGLMFLATGMGVFWAAVLHLVTHAFFKACLFLGAGSVMHGNGDETDIKKLGGLRREQKWTWATFAIASLAATGLLPLSGFFSKDAILHGVHGTTLAGYEWVTGVAWGLGLATTLSTAFYMTRLYLLTFEGPRSPEAKLKHAHESHWPMVLPLVVLAGLSVVALVHGLPLIHNAEGEHLTLIQDYLSPAFRTTDSLLKIHELVHRHAEHGLSGLYQSWVTAWAIAMAGAGIACFLYLKLFPRGQAASNKPLAAPLRALQSLVRNKFYIDEIYDRLVIRPLSLISLILYRLVDSTLIDTLGVRGVAWGTRQAGGILRYVQSGDVQSYAAIMALALVSGVAYVLLKGIP